jgi:hypothetical protein
LFSMQAKIIFRLNGSILRLKLRLIFSHPP